MVEERAGDGPDDAVRRAIPRWLTVLLGLAGATLAVLGMRAAASVLAPILLALVLTVTVHPVMDRLRARGAPRWLAVMVAALIVDGVLLGLVVGVAISLGQLATVLPQYAQQWNDLLDGLRDTLTRLGVGPDQVQQALHSIQPGTVAQAVTGLLGGLLGATTTLVFVLATVVFMCADAAALPTRLTRAAEPSRLGPALDSFARSTRSYIVVTSVFGFIVATLDTVALAILGIPLALLWGLLSFITNYIPNIGFLIGLIPPTLLGLLVDGPKTAILVVVLYSVINFLLQSVVQPVFVGDAVGLSVTVTFLSLVVWAWVLGPLGAILSVPLTLLFRAVLLEADPDAAWARALVAHGSGVPHRSVGRGRRSVREQEAAAPSGTGAAAGPGEPIAQRPVPDPQPSPRPPSVGELTDPRPAGHTPDAPAEHTG